MIMNYIRNILRYKIDVGGLINFDIVLANFCTFLNLGFWDRLKDKPSEITRSAIATVRRVSLEVIIFCMLLSPVKKIKPFWGVVGFLSGDLLQLVLKDDVSYIAVVFDEYRPLEVRWIFDSTTSDDLSCKRDMDSSNITSIYDTSSFSTSCSKSPEISPTTPQKRFIFFTGENNTQKMMTSNNTRLTVAIADLIVFEDLSFNQFQKPRFKKVLELAITVSKCY